MRRAVSTPPELPGYTFVKLLGSGGFSDVFLYEQHLPKRRVAVKVLLTEELTPANRAAFVAEANLMAQLSAHPYIVSIFHADVAADARPYFVMEYCSGPSLAERYKREPLAVVDVLRTGVRVAGAVATAHAAGILHRDIKPANVLTNDYGWPALTDFGISSALDDEIPLHTTTLGGAGGDTGGTTGSASVGMSVPWSPPEMFEDDPSPDVRADVFSLAATLHTLLAGQTPFEVRGRANGALDLIGRIERGLVTPLERTDVPRSLVAVLAKGMATRREDRFATAVDFARALQRVELELGYAPTAIDVPNLSVDDSVRADVADGAEETRARGVSTIEAQQPGAPAVAFGAPALAPAAPSFVPPSAPAAPDDDVTRQRGATPVIAQPPMQAPPQYAPHYAAPPAGAPAFMPPGVDDATQRRRPAPEPVAVAPVMAPMPAPVPAEPAPPASKANRLVLWFSGAAVLLVAAGLVIAMLPGLLGSASPAPSTPAGGGTAPNKGGGSAVVAVTPTPVLESVQERDGALEFVVDNPSPQKGDVFIWRRSDRGSEQPRHSSEDGVLTVEEYDGGSVCVEVRIVRSGKESANSLEECFPA